MTATLISAFITLLVVIDPIGLGPIFIGLTLGLDPLTRRKIALEACLIAFCVLAGTALIGDWLLRMLGISLAAFRIAGGLLLFAIAFEMVFGHRMERKASMAGVNEARGIAAFPLAIPLMAGPGAITAMVLLAGRLDGNMPGLALLIAIMGIVIAASLAVFLASGRLGRLLGVQGQMVLGRLLGVLLAALAVQYVADGILALAQP
jgi:multiple antibiotic resistance protein